MRSMPIIIILSMLFLSSWISVGSYYADEIEVLTQGQTAEFAWAEMNELSDLIPGSQGSTSNKVRKGSASDTQFNWGKRFSFQSSFFFSTGSGSLSFLALSSIHSNSADVVFSNNLTNAFYRVFLHLHFCNWQI